jgi:hypothetical protein
MIRAILLLCISVPLVSLCLKTSMVAESKTMELIYKKFIKANDITFHQRLVHTHQEWECLATLNIHPIARGDEPFENRHGAGLPVW